jgi:2-dehydro-3-deoxyphosphogluconate aldolase / (4S)-4-hydroxy-2-oxoglutarate aldolase
VVAFGEARSSGVSRVAEELAQPLRRIAAQRVLPILRTESAEDAIATARACAAAGVGVVELTRSIPDVDGALRELADDDLLLGIGTVTTADEVASSVAAGARFVVSFAHIPEVIAAAQVAGVPAIAGAFTPTEVLACTRAGAAAVKLFSARELSPGYVADLHAVMPEVELIVTGGIPVDGVRPWLDAGAIAVGLGGALGTAAGVGEAEVERRCRAAIRASE